MRLMKAGAVQVVVLVIAMLAAIGAWEVTKAVVHPAYGGFPLPGCDPTKDPTCPNPALPTHFTCYKIQDKHPEVGFVAEVRIDNQFETSFSRVKDQDRLLCTPTRKLLISISPVTHDRDRDDDDRDRDRDKDKDRDKDRDKEREKDKGKK